MRKRKFWFHYNKPKSQQMGRPIISLHYDGKCHFLSGLQIMVGTRAKIRKRQPYFVMEGEYNSVTVRDGIAIVE